jgi:Luciferase
MLSRELEKGITHKFIRRTASSVRCREGGLRCGDVKRAASQGWIVHSFSNWVLIMSNGQVSKQNALADLGSQILAWPGISKHPHSYGGAEFRFGRAEVGHLHDGGTLDIPFPKAVHDEILAQGLAEEHRWAPDSGWTTFRIRNAADIEHARWLMRLSYLRYALKKAADPRQMLDQESERLRLAPRFRSLFDSFISKSIDQN